MNVQVRTPIRLTYSNKWTNCTTVYQFEISDDIVIGMNVCVHLYSNLQTAVSSNLLPLLILLYLGVYPTSTPSGAGLPITGTILDCSAMRGGYSKLNLSKRK